MRRVDGNHGGCVASELAGAWISVGLAEDKGEPFAEMVVASNRWAFPRLGLDEARRLLAENGDHCRCQASRGREFGVRRVTAVPQQLGLFD